MKKLLLSVIAIGCIPFTACEPIGPPDGAGQGSSTQPYGAPLTVEVAAGMVTIREAGKVVTSFTAARHNVEKTRWYDEQEKIVVKSRGNHGPATVELFDSRSGKKLGSVMAYEAATGPQWAQSMAE